MRLIALQTKAICETAQACFGLDVRVWLFGSRVDDLAKGGDIDLYIESQMDNAADLITRHADRLNWAMAQLQPHWPFSAATISQLSYMDWPYLINLPPALASCRT